MEVKYILSLKAFKMKFIIKKTEIWYPPINANAS